MTRRVGYGWTLALCIGCGGGTASSQGNGQTEAAEVSTAAQQAAAPATATLPAGAKVVAKLQLRDATLSILVGNGEQRFALADHRGGLELVGERELRQRHPAFYQVYRQALADGRVDDRPFVDASVDTTLSAPTDKPTRDPLQ
jgi:hypothetical protein